MNLSTPRSSSLSQRPTSSSDRASSAPITSAEILDAVPFAMALLDTDLRYLAVNRAVAAHSGLSREQHVGLRPGDVVGFVPAELQAALHRALAGHPTSDLRMSAQFPAEPGLVRYFRSMVFPLRDSQRRVVAVAVTSVEVTEQVLAEVLRDDAVRVAQEAASWAMRLYGVGVALAAARSLDEIVAAVSAECAQPLSARALAIGLASDDGITGRIAAVEGQLPLARRRAPFRLDEPLVTAEVLRTGTARFLGDPHSWSEQFPAAAREALAARVAALACVPMTVSGRILGALVLGWSVSREFTEGERRFLETVATLCAQALERVRLFEQQRSAAESLQRSLLPERLPAVAGLDTAAAYLPATEGLQVGGDWYDVVELGDGTVLLSLGDVAGSGVPAAVVMGQLRNGLRAMALRERSPARLLDWLEELLDVGAEQFATLVLARLDPRTGEATFASAGHLPPILLPADGPATMLDVPPSLPLGVGVALAGRRTDTVMALPDGAAVVLYTDGLVEARDLPVGLGIDRLREAVTDVPRLEGRLRAADLCEHVMVAVAAAQERSDDVAVLVARRNLVPASRTPRRAPTVASLPLAGQGTDAARSRRWAVEQVLDWGLPELTDSLRLVVSEMVTNALVHASGASKLRLRRLRDGVRVEVEDRLANLPRVRQTRPDAASGRGLLIVQALSDRWGSHAVPGGKVVWAHLPVTHLPVAHPPVESR